MIKQRSTHLLDTLLILFGLVVICSAPFVGILDISLQALLNPEQNDRILDVFWRLRIPRVVAGFLVGGALSLCGVVFQAIFHNPLASPFTLGVSSGASFGAALSIVFGIGSALFGFSAPAVFSMIGALLTIALIYWSGQRALGLKGTSMLLMGVVINFFFGSLVVFLQYLSDIAELFSLMRWLMGSLEVVDLPLLLPFAVVFATALSCSYCMATELDLISLGDEMAQARGVDVQKKRLQFFFICSLLVALAVTLAGPIGFVGIIIPHATRTLYRPTHRSLLLRSAWLGGIALVLCDAVGRSLIPPAEIPVGIVTAIIGAPLFALILFSNKSVG